MSIHPRVAQLIAVVLTLVITSPIAFFVATPRVSADQGGAGCVAGLVGGLLSLLFGNVPVSDKVNTAVNTTTSLNSIASCAYQTIVVPALRQMIRGFLQQATKATVAWINGNNSSGQPSFVQNLGNHLQAVGDTAALSFIAQVQRGALSAVNQSLYGTQVGSAVAVALNKNYLQSTSLAGFFAANQCTFANTPNTADFMNGHYSVGGVSAWLALTTVPANNPYALYQLAGAQLASNVNQIQTNRRQDLIQAGGILSFCPSNTTSKIGVNARTGILNPQISCTSPDGTPVNAVTPGSTISSYLQANVNSGIGQLVSAQDLDSAIGQVVTALANNLLNDSGIFGSQSPSSSSSPAPTQSPSIAANSAVALANSLLNNVATYSSSWQAIASAANTASTSVNALIAYCTAKQGVQYTSPTAIAAQISAGQSALSNEIAPVIAQAQAVPATMASTTALANTVKAEAAATINPNADQVKFSLDSAQLAQQPPTTSDVLSAQSAAAVTGNAQNNETDSQGHRITSLNVIGGSLVDQMNLISTNAQALQSKCDPVPPILLNGGNY